MSADGGRANQAGSGELAGKVAFVTGAARGQGRAHAVALAGAGADVLLLDVCARPANIGYAAATEDELAETAELAAAQGVRVRTEVADVRDGKAVRAFLDDAYAELGRLDVVIANAGINQFRLFTEMDDEDWDDMISINLTGVYRTVRAAVPHMIAAGNGGSLVLISSVGGVKLVPYMCHYTAAKHGIVGLMRALAVELADYGIRVNTINPGGVDTAFATDSTMAVWQDDPHRASVFEKSFSPLHEPYLCTPEEIAEVGLWLASPRSRAVTGQTYVVDFGVTAR